MDEMLITYLKSGEAWILIGTGPSIEMGYPNWEDLARYSIDLIKQEIPENNLEKINSFFIKKQYPSVFNEAWNTVGGMKLLNCLQQKLKPTQTGKIYDLIARWPVSIYLTTNYDDEIQNSLTKLGQSYITYLNNEDHFGFLDKSTSGAIFKLHGDLRSEKGLVLTSLQYKNILNSPEFDYWRTKMTSVFQMMSLIVIGHSLSDSNIKHILEIAKKGAGIVRPIFWLAPNVTVDESKHYLEYYKIRVIPYTCIDGDHKNLIKVIENINDYVPPREDIHLNNQIANIIESPLNEASAATAFFVFNKLATNQDLEERRFEIILSAIKAKLPDILKMETINISTILESIGWSKGIQNQMQIVNQIRARAISSNLFAEKEGNLKVSEIGLKEAKDNLIKFNHIKNRFLQSLELRLKKSYDTLHDSDCIKIAKDINTSLTGFFRECGLTLATLLFREDNSQKQPTLPLSLLRFISNASMQYENYQHRQIFSKISTDIFAHSESIEREYLGQIAQGYFAYNALGMFGDFAVEKTKRAKEYVWIIDSNVQIASLALGTSSNMVIKETILMLNEIGIRIFSTESIFDETFNHLYFANKVIEKNGISSPYLMAAATGKPPYNKSNLFIEGFLKWQSLGNPFDWGAYLYQIFKSIKPSKDEIKKALNQMGIEIVPFDAWPGFCINDFNRAEQYKESIVQKLQQHPVNKKLEIAFDPYKKAKPESEILVIIEKERAGDYYILSNKNDISLAWFISDTSILNIVAGNKITWQPEAFLRFATTLFPNTGKDAEEKAFQIILWSLAQSGVRMIDEKIISTIFGPMIDQHKINLLAQLKTYDQYVENKYGESPEAILKRIPYENIPCAAMQFANEILEEEKNKRIRAEEAERIANKDKKNAEEELNKLARFKKKYEKRKAKTLKTKKRIELVKKHKKK